MSAIFFSSQNYEFQRVYFDKYTEIVFYKGEAGTISQKNACKACPDRSDDYIISASSP